MEGHASKEATTPQSPSSKSILNTGAYSTARLNRLRLATPHTTTTDPVEHDVELSCGTMVVGKSLVVQEKLRRIAQKSRVKWDNTTIENHNQERGILYGTMKVNQPDTPFLFIDSRDEDSIRVFQKDGVHQQLDADELKVRLGLISIGSSQDDQASDDVENSELAVNTTFNDQNLS